MPDRNVQADNTDNALDSLVDFYGQIGIRFIDPADELEKIIGLKVDLLSRNGIREEYFQSLQSDLIYV